jgi:1-acyl-sn-glycerol-3-phosphate acyltransferase
MSGTVARGMTSTHDDLGTGHSPGRLKRRARTVSTLLVAVVALTLLVPVWLPLAVAADALRLRFRFPTVRLAAFGLCWAWLETAGVLVSAGLWLAGRSSDMAAHVRVQRWWADSLMRALGATTGLRLNVSGVEAFSPGPAVVLSRHASLADSLVSAHIIMSMARLEPRYVLKRELLVDPCLDIVGHRLPNHFLDRDAPDSAGELAALTRLAHGMSERDAAVIFPEGTRANPAKRARALERIAARDPDRAGRLGALQSLLPPRPAGAQALLAGAPAADVVLCWHVGFDGLDSFGGILRHLSRPVAPVRFVARRVARATLPDVADTQRFTTWLDDRWLELDAEVTAALGAAKDDAPGGPPGDTNRTGKR